MTEPSKPVLTIRTTEANVSDLKTEQHRWVCPCGKRGPCVSSATEASAQAARHGMFDFFGEHRGIHLETVERWKDES